MRISRYFLAFLILFGTVMTFSSYADETTAIEWDGKTALKNGFTYYVDKEIKVRSNFSLPKDSSLIIYEGANLTISKDINAVIRGKLTIDSGGTLAHKYGTVNMTDTSVVTINGEYLQYVNTEVKVKTSKFTVGESGGYTCSSVFNVYGGAKVTNKGYIALTNSSAVTLSDVFDNKAGSEMRIQGKFTITISGVLTNEGHISIGRNGEVMNSGRFTIEREASFTRVGRLARTKNGFFADYRVTFKYEDMTVSILVDEPKKKIKGIDVSVWNGDIDWKKVRADGIKFAIIRAGRGSMSSSKPMAVDDNFKKNVEGALANNIDVGVYFYSYAMTVSQAKKEAEFLVKTIAPYKITYPIIFDLEDPTQLKLGKKKLTQMVEAFFEVLMENGYYPMVYSYKSFIEDNLDMTKLDRYAVWVAHWNVDETTYQGGYYIWQYSSTGRVNGITGDVDLNISYRDFPTILRKYNLNKLG